MGWFINALNREPAMMLSALLAAGAVFIPLTVVPMRRAMRLPTYQWDSDPEEHPTLSTGEETHKVHHFDDADKLAAWSQHTPYKYLGALAPKSAADRDFPAARERLSHKLC